MAYISSGVESLAVSSFKKEWETTIISVVLTWIILTIIGQISRKAIERVMTLAEDSESSPHVQTGES